MQILFLLSKKESDVKNLLKELASNRKWTPQRGTFYLALRQLREKNLIGLRKEGKHIYYFIMPEGKKAVKEASDYFVHCFGEFFTGRLPVS